MLSAAIEGMFLNSELFDHQRGASNKGYKKIDMGTLVLSTQNLHLGNANVNLRFEHGMVSPAYKTYHIHDCSVKLIAEWVKSEKAKRFFYDATTVGASVCRRNVEWDTLYDQPLYLPSLVEQEYLATFLSALSSRIKKQTELVEHLKKYKRGLLNRYFRSNVGDCKYIPLSELILEIMDGDWIESKDQSSFGIRLIQTGNVGVGEYIDKPDSAKYISASTFEHLHCTEIYPGDILISRLPSPAGRACIVPITNERMITAVDCTIVRCDDTRCIREYLIQFLNSPQYFKEVESFLAGGTRQRISRKNLESILVPIVQLPEQKYIANILSTFDKKIHNEAEQLQELIRYKRGLLQALFV